MTTYFKSYQKCLHCNKPGNTQNYTCSCVDESWAKEYRMLDIVYELSEKDKETVIHALENYDMNHPSGIMQYIFTPHPEHKKNIKFKIGLTPFIPLKNLGELYGNEIFLKNEAENPSGCFKDRETVMAALHSKAMNKNKAVIYSSGNAAASASLFAAHMDFHLITCVAGNTYPEKIKYITKRGSDVICIGDNTTSFEEGYRLFAEMNAEGVFLENGFDNWSVRNPYRVQGDKTSAIEIVKQYEEVTGEAGAVPDFIIVPTGNGSCLAGIWKGFRELKQFGIIEKLPKMVSAAIKNASPISKALERNILHRPAICDLDKVADSDKEIGSTIVAEEGYDSIEATKAVVESSGLAMEVTKKEIQNSLVDLLEKERDVVLSHKILPEPASLVTLAAIKKMRQSEIIGENSKIVAFISGHGAKARELLMRMLKERPELQKVMNRIFDKGIEEKGDFKSVRPGEIIKAGKDVQELTNIINQLSKELYEENIFPV